MKCNKERTIYITKYVFLSFVKPINIANNGNTGYKYLSCIFGKKRKIAKATRLNNRNTYSFSINFFELLEIIYKPGIVAIPKRMYAHMLSLIQRNLTSITGG